MGENCGLVIAFTALPSFRARAGLANGEWSAAKVGAIEGLDGFPGLRVGAHFHEPETTGPPGISVRDHLDPGHGALLLKEREQILVRGVPRQVSDEEVLRHRSVNSGWMTIIAIALYADDLELHGRFILPKL